VESFVQKLIDIKKTSHQKGIDLLLDIARDLQTTFELIKQKKITIDLSEKYTAIFEKSIYEITCDHSSESQEMPSQNSSSNEIVTSESLTSKKSDTIRIKHEQLDYLQGKLKRLMQIKVQMSTFASQLGQEFFDEHFPKQLQELVNKLEIAAMESLEGLIKLRARPVTVLRPFCEKLVSDTARSLGKEVHMEFVSNDYLEIDPPIIDLLVSSLGHIIKNSIDHGIEMPEDRLKNGKGREGKITLNLQKLDKSNFLLTIKDDGRGIQVEKLKASVLQKGLIEEKIVENMNKEQLNTLIFLDGLTTKETSEVSEISGRGVGMSAVKQGIEDMSGSVSIKSETNVGTEFEIRLPLYFVL
jgi:two-component system chemotaxis sensor kinase CheA